MAQPKEDTSEKEGFIDELKPGTKLMHGQYTIDRFLNAGGFGITYLASDSLDRKVVIKECFPGAFCRRSRYVVQARSRAHQNELKSIVRLFVQEARSLAKLDHPNIVGVHQVFEDNDTAYMALDFVEGRDLLDTIEDPNHGLTAPQIKNILKEVLGAVGFIHDQGILHRDISPDNILINKELHPVLIDFGAAREEATKQSRVLSALRVVKDGYSPQEFYIAGSDQSPSSDLYALAASFHHLITGDVPPNSQARLAAIASGDEDPYQKIEGRFPDYDDNFLGALDKALAVLPKDRVQSAKEWIQMIEGTAGNVTPLNPTAAGKSATAEAGSAALASDGAKSKMPLLLGSAAVVALLVGVGIMTVSGGEDAPAAVETPVIAPTAEANPAPVVQAPVETVVVEAPAEPETAAVADVAAPAPDVVAESSVVAALEEAITDPATSLVENIGTPEISADPLTATSSTESVAVVGPDVLTPAPADIRPLARPADVTLEATPVVIPLPEPSATPNLVSVAPQETTSFPEQITSLPTPDSDTQQFAFPASPAEVSQIGTGPAIDILAVTPGNEIIIAGPIVSTIQSDWSIQLPFVAASDNSNVIARAGAVAPSWVSPGVAITGVNGTPISAISQISTVLRDQTIEADLGATLPVTFATRDLATGTQADQSWFLPVTQRVELADGSRFETFFAGASWQTRVMELAPEQTGGLQVGDVLSSYIGTSEVLDDRTTLAEILIREQENGTEQLTFAVLRDGSLWVASLNNLAEAN